MGQAIIVDTSGSPGASLHAVPVDRIELTDGYWRDRFDVNHETSLRELWDLLANPDAGHVLTNFRLYRT